MSTQNKGVLVTAAIRANSPLDLIATAYSSEIMGGLHTATASSDRDAIFTVRREWGMLCYVINEKKTYQLEYGYFNTTITDNKNWKEFRGSGTEWIDSVSTVLTVEPSYVNDGDRYLVGRKYTDSFSGPNWGAQSKASFVAQWVSNMSNWEYTYPQNGMSVRVDDEDNSVYRYEGTWQVGGEWWKEKESQVRYIYATTSNNKDYIATSDPYFDVYDIETIYIVKFAAVNTGSSASLNINNLGQIIVKKTDGSNLSNIVSNDITTSYQYLLTYDGTYFELHNMTGGSGLNIKNHILPGESVIVPVNTEYWVYGDLVVDGTLDNSGYVIVANGSLTASGTFSNSGSYSNIYFAEINGLGVNNYVPHWISPYMLTATSSITDNNKTVNITSVTFSINSNVVIPKGASQGFVFTCDSTGYGEWKLNTGTKYSATMSVTASFTYSIPHGLNSYDIVMSVWDEGLGATGGDLVWVDTFNKTLNSIDIISSVTSDLIRVVIIS